jgi:hypothetical protein
MRKFGIMWALTLLVLGGSIELVFAKTPRNMVCTARYAYSIDNKQNGKLNESPRSFELGQKFVIDRFTGNVQGDLLNNSHGRWQVRVNSTGNDGGDFFPNFSYLGVPDVSMTSGGQTEVIRPVAHLAINPKYSGTDEYYRKLDDGASHVFTLIRIGSVTTGVCNSL